MFGKDGGMYLMVPDTPLTRASLTSILTVRMIHAFGLIVIATGRCVLDLMTELEYGVVLLEV